MTGSGLTAPLSWPRGLMRAGVELRNRCKRTPQHAPATTTRTASAGAPPARQRLQPFQVVQFQPLQHDAPAAGLLQLMQMLDYLGCRPDDDAALAQLLGRLPASGHLALDLGSIPSKDEPRHERAAYRRGVAPVGGEQGVQLPVQVGVPGRRLKSPVPLGGVFRGDRQQSSLPSNGRHGSRIVVHHDDQIPPQGCDQRQLGHVSRAWLDRHSG